MKNCTAATANRSKFQNKSTQYKCMNAVSQHDTR